MPKIANPRQEAFCQEYAKDLNGGRAYNAVYKVKNENTANACAARMLTNAKIKQRVKELTSETAERNKLDADQIVAMWRGLAEFNIADFMEFNGTEAYVKDFSMIPREALACVKSIETVQRQEGDTAKLVTKLTFFSKEKALDALSRIAGIYNDKVQLTNKTLEDYLKELS